MTLGQRLKICRKKTGWNQQQAAEKIGISKSVLSNYERDYRDPDTSTLKKISDVYNVTTDYLLGKSQNPIAVTETNDDGKQGDLLNKTINEAIQELKDEDTLLFMNDGEFDEETALLIKKALKNGIKFIDELKKKE
ncbi:helix-turn-helix domain-containing protein [Bacillus inaquosorum]|uniref:helix-turn-helix domain-containing protein n=1 Tax=Bacillus inaquosorum TaxID=483913 RepID=UPI00227EAA60|nr:helix-turn-helix transcriptional regulator [Bacillus inaquosorum]MCY7929790.1 helix-turn-helix transcriptional regulator [Bacillus inaquosorum]MCY8279997.1 helix-turn-helix transcriptional regulator [Bacillus inaquosorum]MCY8723082.1 helix-turn-helix transcriptional regulator [Bacillus inaquosorum]MCY8768988.1 helix-turn-helix transcriptional regulator [Bacillus inaquosorum]MCY9384151.1 helix-turn-helix transcriptional regulator [Bacillus inaquosorum]